LGVYFWIDFGVVRFVNNFFEIHSGIKAILKLKAPVEVKYIFYQLAGYTALPVMIKTISFLRMGMLGEVNS
jgi:hypothetical protein